MDAKTRRAIEAAQSRRLRAEILRQLKGVGRMSSGAILGALLILKWDVVEQEVLDALRWLKGRGYATFSEERDRQFRRLPSVDDAEITDKGMDALDGSIEDSGLDLS